MRPNSQEMLDTAEQLFQRHGDWASARDKSVVVNGVYMVDVDQDAIASALERLKVHQDD